MTCAPEAIACVPKVWRRSWKRSARTSAAFWISRERRPVHRLALEPLEDAAVGLGVALERLQPLEEVEHLLGGWDRVHALALREPVAAHVGE